MKLEERLQIRVSKKMMEGLEQEAARRGVKVSDLVRMTLSDLVTPGPKVDPRRPMRDV